jgi:hypothetical protein
MQALDTYKKHDWDKIENHVNFVVSRLNFNLKNITKALEHIETILNKSKNEPIDLNETNIIKDYILYTNHLINHKSDKPMLPLIQIPFVDSQQIKLDLISSNFQKLTDGRLLANSIDFNYKESHSDTWHNYEEQLYVDSFKTLGVLFCHQQYYYDSSTDNSQNPKICEMENMKLLLNFKNPFRVSLLVRNIRLLWRFIDESNVEFTNELQDYDDLVENTNMSELLLEPRETNYFELSLRPKASGSLNILGLSGFCCFFTFCRC